MRPVSKVRIFGVRLGAAALAIYWFAIFTSTHLPTLPDVLHGVSDKTMHFGAYFGLALLLCYVTNGENHWRRFGGILLLGAFYGALDELTQSFVPGRSMDVYDWGADILGIVSAITVYAAGRACRAKFSGSTAMRTEQAT